jgi:hypothetical protein
MSLFQFLGVDRISQQLDRLLPDYLLVFAIPTLANVAWKSLEESGDCPDRLELLKRLQSALWFVLEPLMHKNDNFSFSFYKVRISRRKDTLALDILCSTTTTLRVLLAIIHLVRPHKAHYALL